MTILELQGVHKDFKGLTVLNDVNLAIEEGECHAIIGPNGAGKSTLFNVISGKYKPYAWNSSFQWRGHYRSRAVQDIKEGACSILSDYERFPGDDGCTETSEMPFSQEEGFDLAC